MEELIPNRREVFRTALNTEIKLKKIEEKDVGLFLKTKKKRSLKYSEMTASARAKEFEPYFLYINQMMEALDKKLSNILIKLGDLNEQKNVFSKACIADLSATGVKIFLEDEPSVGDRYYLSMDIQGFPFGHFDTVGMIKYVNKDAETHGYTAGIEFIELDDDEKELLVSIVFQGNRKNIRGKDF